MPSDTDKIIGRLRELVRQISIADQEIRTIISSESDMSPDFSSPFFAELQRLLRTADISNLLVLMLAMHAQHGMEE